MSTLIVQGFGGGLLVVQGFGTTGPVVIVSAFAPARDDDVYQDIIARLKALNVFDCVDSYEAGGPEATSDDRRLATVLPGDTDALDDVDPIETVVRGKYAVEIEVRIEDPAERYRVLNQLVNQAGNALNGKCFADWTLPPLTTIRRTNYRPPKGSPTGKAVMNGEWVALSPGYGGFNEAD